MAEGVLSTITHDIEEHPFFAGLAALAAGLVAFVAFHNGVTGQTTSQSAAITPATQPFSPGYYGNQAPTNNYYNPGSGQPVGSYPPSSPSPPTPTPPSSPPYNPLGQLPPGYKLSQFGQLINLGGTTYELGAGGNDPNGIQRIWGVPLQPGQSPLSQSEWNTIGMGQGQKTLIQG